MHKNSQLRIYLEEAIYFVTTNTLQKYPYFKNYLLAEILMKTIFYNQQLKKFKLFFFVIMPDHMHILFKPNDANFSEIMRSIKTNSSREINRYLSSRRRGRATSPTEVFHWQKSFYDHIIRDQKDFNTHYQYIINNPIKAGLVKNLNDYPFVFTSESID